MPDILELTITQFEGFNWMNIDDFKIQHVELQSS